MAEEKFESAESLYNRWFDHIQALHNSSPNRNMRQVEYDQTLKQNYPWVFFNLRQTEVHDLCYDLGCGYGTMALGAYTLGYRVHAFDVTDEYVNLGALQQRGIGFSKLDVENPSRESADDMPCGGQAADVVIFTEVLEHLQRNPLVALNTIRRMLQPGGLLILSTPRRESGVHQPGVHQQRGVARWQDIGYDPPEDWLDAHMYVYREREVREMLDVAGFRLLTSGLVWNGITYGVVAYRSTVPSDETFRTLAGCHPWV